MFVCQGYSGWPKNQMSVSFSGLQRGSLNIPHRQGEEEGKLINIGAESLANRQQGEGMSGLRRNWEGVRLPYAFFPPPFAREGGRERAENGRRESEQVSEWVQDREVYGTVSFLPSDITELEYVLGAARTFCPSETQRDLTKSWTVRGSFHRGSNLRQLSAVWSPRDSHSGAENELSGECVCCSHCCVNALSWLC